MNTKFFALSILLLSLSAHASDPASDVDADFKAAYKAAYGKYDGTRTGQLLEQVMYLDDKCRGGSGDKPKTWEYCKKRDHAVSELEALGWCNGGDFQASSKKEWRLCTSTIPPRLTPDTFCDSVASPSGVKSENLMERCLKREQDHYEVLKRIWADIPEPMQEHCAEIAKTTGGSYMTLESCVFEEVKSKQGNSKFKFNY